MLIQKLSLIAEPVDYMDGQYEAHQVRIIGALCIIGNGQLAKSAVGHCLPHPASGMCVDRDCYSQRVNQAIEFSKTECKSCAPQIHAFLEYSVLY